MTIRPKPTTGAPRRPPARSADALAARRRMVLRPDLEDALSAVPERNDLERLFERSVPMPDILRLGAREVNPGRIQALLDSPDLRRDLKRLLDS